MTVAPVLRGDLDRIADMIAMAVRDEDEIGLDLVRLLRAQGVVVEKRVQEQAVLAGLDCPGIVAQPRDFGCHRRFSLREWGIGMHFTAR